MSEPKGCYNCYSKVEGAERKEAGEDKKWSEHFPERSQMQSHDSPLTRLAGGADWVCVRW